MEASSPQTSWLCWRLLKRSKKIDVSIVTAQFVVEIIFEVVRLTVPKQPHRKDIWRYKSDAVPSSTGLDPQGFQEDTCQHRCSSSSNTIYSSKHSLLVVRPYRPCRSDTLLRSKWPWLILATQAHFYWASLAWPCNIWMIGWLRLRSMGADRRKTQWRGMSWLKVYS